MRLCHGVNDAASSLRREGAAPLASALLCLRFASRGSAAAPENLQPFAADGVAFAHNGAGPARCRARGADVGGAGWLRGTTDSNAILLVGDRLVVVHSPGTVPPPHAAFTARGWTPEALPPGHGEGHNDLWTQTLRSRGPAPRAGGDRCVRRVAVTEHPRL